MKKLLGNKREKALKKLRKDIRSGFYAYLVLLALEQKGELHGYALRKELETTSNSHLVPSEGTLYDVLKSLKKYGLVEDFWVQAGGRPRKSYRLTSLGKEVLKELKSEVLEIIRIVGGKPCE